MMFGEHLGEPPPYGDYFNAGMRLVDNPLQSNMNSCSVIRATGLQGLDAQGSYGFDATALGVMYAQSHDNDYSSRRELQHALYLTRAGIGSIYTDGNHQSQTLEPKRRRFSASRQHHFPRTVQRSDDSELALHPQPIRARHAGWPMERRRLCRLRADG